MPDAILRLGPDHSEAQAWLWQAWGTTQALRHVSEQGVREQERGKPSESGFRVSFWSADWSPWQALLALRARWPALRFELQPIYDTGA